MLSSQGGTVSASSGLLVRFTIGQQSITGSKSGPYLVQQGYQQSNWDARIAENNWVTLVTTTFPNPLLDKVYFTFSDSIGEFVSIQIFDVLGKPVLAKSLRIFENTTSIDLSHLSSATYFVQLSTNQYRYHTKIIKHD